MNNKENILKKNRKNYIEWLRVISAFAVVLIHVSASYIDSYPIDSLELQTLLFLDGISRWSVPVFVMISGAVTLNKDYTTKRIGKKALRLCLLFILWSVIYAGIAYFNGVRLKTVFSTAVLGAVHLWYLPLAVGLYLMIPVFNRIVRDEKVLNYVLCLGIVFNFLLPTILGAARGIDPYIGDTFLKLTDMYRLPIFTGYVVYYLLGWKLSNCDINKNIEKKIYILGLICFVISVLGNAMLTKYQGEWSLWFSNELRIFVLGQAVAVFVFAKNILAKRPNKIVSQISACSLGIYLIHYELTDVMWWHIAPGKWSVIEFGGIILGITIAIYVISFLITWLIKKVPILKRIV